MLKQDLNQEAKFSGIYDIRLLFQKENKNLSNDILYNKLLEKFVHVDVVAKSGLSSFALTEHQVEYEGGKKAPAQVIITEFMPIKEPIGDDIIRTQFWDCPNGVELLDSCSWQIMVSDFMARGLPALERAEILSDLLEVALDIFPSCVGVYFSSSGKLLTAEGARNNPYSGPCRFFHGGVNARFFNVQNSDSMVVDTLGLYALNLPDVQYHFRNLDPNSVVRHAYNTAIYQFKNNVPIESGNTIEGIEAGSRWKCQYENSLIQPVREVLDIFTNEFVAGNRE